MSIRSDVLNWLYEGVEDLKTAEQLFKLERYAHACFHAQQAAEKALKAVIMAKLRKLARGHDLVELYSQVEHLLKLPCADELAELSSFYVQARYPNAGLTRPSMEISRRQAGRALGIARRVVDAVEAALKAEEGT